MSGLDNKRWFFLNGDLYRYISANRAQNTLKAYCYTDHRPKMLTLSEAKRYRKPAFDIANASQMLNRAKRTIYYYIEHGFVKPSGKSDPPNNPNTGKWWFTDDDILELRDAIFENSMGAKAPIPLPTREEVLAMTRTKKMLYVQEGDQFVPVWRASVW